MQKKLFSVTTKEQPIFLSFSKDHQFSYPSATGPLAGHQKKKNDVQRFNESLIVIRLNWIMSMNTNAARSS
jgi:hypothetical protein